MWILTHTSTDENFYINKSQTSVGRKGQDIDLTNDLSMSRLHANLILEDDVLYVQDAKSKYGTFVNGNPENDSNRLAPAVKTRLEDGDKIAFGRLGSEFIVQHMKVETVMSVISGERKQKLSAIFKSFNIQTSDTITKTCSHLTMPEQTTVSHKLLQALTMCIPVVTPRYWAAFQDSVAKNAPLPKPLDYAPKIKPDIYITTNTISLAMDPRRKTIFAGKTFIFVSKSQSEIFAEIIQNAGGKVLNLAQSKLSTTQCCAKNAIVVQIKSDSQSQNEDVIAKINAALKKKNRQMIVDHEIGLAVLHASIEKYCNPEYLDAKLIEPNNSALLRATTSKVIAANTESENVEFPAPSRMLTSRRLRMRENAPAAVIDLDMHEESDQEVPEVPETQLSADTQTSTKPRESHEKSPITTQEIIPETQQSVASSTPAGSPTTRASKRTPSQATIETSPSRFTRSKQSSAQPSTFELFNFTDTSLSGSMQRKRKTSESSDDSNPPVANKRSKRSDPKPAKNQIIDDDSEEEVRPTISRNSRKRTADKESNSDGGLFNFNTNFVKKMKPIEDLSQEQAPKRILPIAKPRSPVRPNIEKFIDYDDDSCDAGEWLPKKLFSVDINDSTDGIKTEKLDLLSIDTEDIKPRDLSSLFNVLENTISTTSSLVSHRKQFVKNQNFKPQRSVVSTKVLLVQDTRISLDFVD